MPGEGAIDKIYLNRSAYHQAEKAYAFKKHENVPQCNVECKKSECNKDDTESMCERIKRIELENTQLKSKVATLEKKLSTLEPTGATTTPKPKKDDDFDLFADDDEEDSEEKKRITEERIKAYTDKKGNKPALIAKSSVMLDVKPWDDETDMKLLEADVRSIAMDGLLWGSSKLVPVAFGVKKLQIQCVIEDDKVSTEALEELICAFEDHIQSVDIVSFNKI